MKGKLNVIDILLSKLFNEICTMYTKKLTSIIESDINPKYKGTQILTVTKLPREHNAHTTSKREKTKSKSGESKKKNGK